MKNRQTISIVNRIILLAGGFTFAFLLGEMVHEFGHYFSHLAFGNTGVGVYLNPFGSSHIVGVTSLPLIQMGVTSAAGPLFNVILGNIIFLILWRRRTPTLIPLLLWGPVALIQESVTFTFGFLTPGGDAGWIAAAGIPKPLIIITGILFLIAGLTILTYVLIHLGITFGESFCKRLLIVLLGMCSLMLVRFLYSALVSPASIMENLVPLLFSLLLSLIVVLIHPLIIKSFEQGKVSPVKPFEKKHVTIVFTFGLSMFIFQILYSIIL